MREWRWCGFITVKIQYSMLIAYTAFFAAASLTHTPFLFHFYFWPVIGIFKISTQDDTRLEPKEILLCEAKEFCAKKRSLHRRSNDDESRKRLCLPRKKAVFTVAIAKAHTDDNEAGNGTIVISSLLPLCFFLSSTKINKRQLLHKLFDNDKKDQAKKSIISFCFDFVRSSFSRQVNRRAVRPIYIFFATFLIICGFGESS